MKQKTAGERIKAIRGDDMSQAEFGALLDSSQGAVSAWERDDKDRSPSAAVYFRLAALARDPDDSVFFLQQAGLEPDAVISVADVLLKKGEVKMDAILATAEEKLNDRMGDQRKREKEGKDVIVPPYEEADRLPFEVSVPAPLVSNQAATFYLVAGSKNPLARVGHGVAPGEIVVFESHKPSYNELVGEKVVFEFDDGLSVGRLGHLGDEFGQHLVLGPADEFPSSWRGPGGLPVISSFTKRKDLLTLHHKPRDVRRFLGVWIAQFDIGVHESWKRSARLHEPKK